MRRTGRLIRHGLSAVVVLAAVLSQPLPASADGSIQYGGSVSGVINDNSFNHFWYFSGSAGDSIIITMTATSGNLVPWMQLSRVEADGTRTDLTYANGAGRTNAQIYYTR
jgi:hypothetical protein